MSNETTTYNDQPASERSCPDPSGSGFVPFKLRVYDGNGNEHESGPVWIEIPTPEPWEPVPDDDAGGHWEQLARMETWAKDYLFEDAECSLDTDAAGSQSLDLFESWEQYRTKRVAGYTFRDCTSVMRLEFPPTDRKPTKNQLATMAELLAAGWVVSAIHFENTEDRREAKQPPSTKENQ